MKPKSISRFAGLQSIRPLALVTAITAFAAGSAYAATYQWDGSASSAWADSPNWASGTTNGQTITVGPAPTGATFAHRLNINNADTLNVATNEAVYTGAFGNTIYNNGAGGRGLVIGSGAASGGGGSGTLRITGGKLSTVGSGGGDIIGNTSGNTGSLILDGGDYEASATVSMGLTFGVVSNFIINSGTATIPSLATNNITGTIDLNGGTLAMNQFVNSGGGQTVLNLNGGTLKARIPTTAFFPTPTNGNATVYVKSFGAVVNTNTFNITIARPLLEDPASTGGDLTKDGAGTLTLGGVSTISGDVTVSAGGLGVKAGAASWTPSTFTHSGNALNFDLGVYSGANPPLIDVATLTLNTTDTTVNISGSSIPIASEIKILEYGTKSGTGSLKLNIASLPNNMVATLGEDTVNGYYYLNVTSPSATAFTWSGDTNPDGTGNWDIATSLNWNANAVAYTQPALVTFPNIAAGGAVTITADVAPISFDINNASGNLYTFAGAGKITGGTGITKAGTGIVTFNGAAHSHTGPVAINAGAMIKKAADATTGNITVAADDVSFVLDGVTDGSGQTLYLSGRGATASSYFFTGSAFQRGALQAHNGASTWQGNIVLTANAGTPNFNRIGVQNGASLTLTGIISESVVGAGLVLRAGALGNDITLGGAGTYTYTGGTEVFSTGASIILGDSNKLPTNRVATFESGGATVFDLHGFNQECAGIRGGAVGAAATITNNGATPSVLTCNVPIATAPYYQALIADGTATVSLVKNGDGTQTLASSNTYSGTTTVNAGTLNIFGNQTLATGAVQVNGGILGGTGTVGGEVTIATLGTIAPGSAPATIDSLDVTANTNIAGAFACDVNGASTDVLGVDGDLNLTGGSLSINQITPGTSGTYVIATYTGTRTGTLGGTLPSGYSVNYDDTNKEVELVIAASGYNTWAGANAGGQTADLDFDYDGVDNGVEYFLGATGSGFTASPTLFASNIATWTNGGNIPFGDYGTQYVIQTSTNLATWTNVLSSDPNLSNIAGSVSYTLNGTGKQFVRLSVTPD